MRNVRSREKTSKKRTPTWFLHLALYLLTCMSYVFSLFEAAQRTLAGFLLLSGIYGVWFLVFHFGERSNGNQHPSGLPVLFCLACATPFLSLMGLNPDWLWVLPVLTTTFMATLRSRVLGLCGTGVLWLSSSLASLLIARHGDISSQVTFLLTFLFSFGFASTIRELALAHVRMQQLIGKLSHSHTELEAAHTQLLEYTQEVEDLSAVRERNRIAREIHDTLGHSLTLLAVRLETAIQLEVHGDAGLHEELIETRHVAKACLSDVRRSVSALRPDTATQGSFEKTLRHLVTTAEITSPQTAVTLDLEEATRQLQPELRQTLYRCAQEALTNIRKHACATKVLVRLKTSEGPAQLTVLDNGQGSHSEDEHCSLGFGLLGMSERVELLGGTLRAGPEPKHGWRVEVVIPLEPQKPAKVAKRSSGEMGARV